MTLRTWTGFIASFTNSAFWTPAGAPRPGDILTIGSGTVTLRNAVLDRTAIQLSGAQANGPTFDIGNVVLGAGTTVTTANQPGNLGQFVFAGTLRAGGWNRNLGTLTATSSDFQRAARLEIDIVNGTAAQHGTATFVNAGTIATNPMGAVTVHAGVSGATLQNLGLISVTGHATLDANVIGSGTVRLGAAIPLHGFTATPDLTTTAGIGSGQTIRFLGGDVLHIDDLADFHGLIAGFSGTPTSGALDQIELSGHDITGSIWQNNGTAGTLTLLEGRSVVGALRFAGSHASGSFSFGHINLVTATGVTHTTSITMNQA